MDSPLSTLGFVIFGITFSIYSCIAKSQPPSPSVSSPPRPPPPPHSPPPSPPYTPPPPPPPHSPPRSPPYTPPPPPHFLPMPPGGALSSSPPNSAHVDPKRKPKKPPVKSKGPFPHRSPPAPRPPPQQMKEGKKIGLLFAGIAGIMQIGVVGFLVFKRRQLFSTKDAFEASV